MHSLNDLLDGVAHKDGAMHRLVFDPKEADRVSQLLANLDQSSAMLNATLADAHEVAGQVKSGPGLAHSLLYDGEVSENTAGILHELHRDLAAVREGNGIAHSLVYGDDSSQHVMGNVNAMSDDLRAIVANVRAGKGTIGALLVDPSVYEDVKMLVGNVERNEVLRSLVRYSIKADEEKPTVEVKSSQDSYRRFRRYGFPASYSTSGVCSDAGSGAVAGAGFGQAFSVEPRRMTVRRRRSMPRSAVKPRAMGAPVRLTRSVPTPSSKPQGVPPQSVALTGYFRSRRRASNGR